MLRRMLVAGLASAVAGLVANGAMAAPKTYSAKDGANSASVQIVDAGGGLYTLTRTGPGSCAAKLDGEAKMTKGTLRLVKDQGGATCTVEITPKGTFVEVIEDSCAEVFRAADCRFDDLPIMLAK